MISGPKPQMQQCEREDEGKWRSSGQVGRVPQTWEEGDFEEHSLCLKLAELSLRIQLRENLMLTGARSGAKILKEREKERKEKINPLHFCCPLPSHSNCLPQLSYTQMIQVREGKEAFSDPRQRSPRGMAEGRLAESLLQECSAGKVQSACGKPCTFTYKPGAKMPPEAGSFPKAAEA